MEFLRGRHLMDKWRRLIPSEEAIANKSVIIFYFSAKWCYAPDCQSVLTHLKHLYYESLKRNVGIEIIFVSSDIDFFSFDNYFGIQGNWYAVPFNDALAEELRFLFGITTIPTVIVCKRNGELITNNGRQELAIKGINVIVAWTD